MTTLFSDESNNPRISYVATGNTSDFPVPFPFFAAADIVVLVDGTRRTDGFTVTGAGLPGGGSVIFGVAPSEGSSVTLVRRAPLRRGTDFPHGGSLRAAPLNEEFDRVVAGLQQVQGDARRTVHLVEHDDTPAEHLDLPGVEERAGRALGFDGDGRLTTYPAVLTDMTVKAVDVSMQRQEPGAVVRSVAAELTDGVVKPQQFGAIGDGQADDTAAFHSAIWTARQHGLVVLVPPGTYRLSSTLVLGGVADFSDGRGPRLAAASLVGMDSGAVLRISREANVPLCDFAAPAGESVGAVLRNLTLEATGDGVPLAVGVRVSASGLRAKGVRVVGFRTGWHVVSSDPANPLRGLRLESCKAEGCVRGWHMTGSSIVDSHFVACGAECDGDLADLVGGPAQGIYPAGTGDPETAVIGLHTACTITGCLVDMTVRGYGGRPHYSLWNSGDCTGNHGRWVARSAAGSIVIRSAGRFVLHGRAVFEPQDPVIERTAGAWSDDAFLCMDASAALPVTLAGSSGVLRGEAGPGLGEGAGYGGRLFRSGSADGQTVGITAACHGAGSGLRVGHLSPESALSGMTTGWFLSADGSALTSGSATMTLGWADGPALTLGSGPVSATFHGPLNTPAIREAPSGGVGIGASAPSHHAAMVGGGGNAFVTIAPNTANVAGVLLADGADARWAVCNRSLDGNRLYIVASPANLSGGEMASKSVVAVTQSGNMGIGVSNPQERLVVAGVVRPGTNAAHDLGTSAVRWRDAYVGSVVTTSDARLKTAVRDIDPDLALELVQALDPKLFRYVDVDIPAVTEEQVVRVPVMDTASVTEIEVDEDAGLARQVTREVQVPRVQSVPVVDAAGDPVLAPDGTPVTHAVPVTEAVTETVEVHPARKETYVRLHAGFMAQELEAACAALGFGDAQSGYFGALVHNPETDFYGIRYEELIAVLWAAVRALAQRGVQAEARGLGA